MPINRLRRREDVVALLAEGVDRNLLAKGALTPLIVALLAEGVDRNCLSKNASPQLPRSPSSRRAWIEIPWSSVASRPMWSRPPRGGRG